MTIDELLAEHPAGIEDLARRVLAYIAGAADWSDQRVYPGWHGVGFHHSELGYVVGVFPRTSSVRVLFEHGHLLGTAPYLEGSGQTRYVDLTGWDSGRIETIDAMLERALAT